MARISGIRQLGYAASTRGFERLLEHFVATARVDPARVVAEAQRRRLPVTGEDLPEQLHSLRRLPLADLDPLAMAVVRSHTLVAGAQGFVTGVGGIATLPLTISADTIGALYWVVRATSGVMNSYGFDTYSEDGVARLRVGLMLSLGVETVTVDGSRVRLERVSRQLLSTPYSQQLLVAGGRQLVRRLSVGATRGRVAGRAVPIVGGALSCAINAGLVRTVSRRALWHYRAQLADWQRLAVPALPSGQPQQLESGPDAWELEPPAEPGVQQVPPAEPGVQQVPPVPPRAVGG